MQHVGSNSVYHSLFVFGHGAFYWPWCSRARQWIPDVLEGPSFAFLLVGNVANSDQMRPLHMTLWLHNLQEQRVGPQEGAKMWQKLSLDVSWTVGQSCKKICSSVCKV